MKSKMAISITDIPEALAGMRMELASITRELAESEALPMVAKRLREIADAFEAGIRPGDVDVA